METFKTYQFDVMCKDGCKIVSKSNINLKNYDFIKVNDVKIEKRIDEPQSMKVVSDVEMDCIEEGNGLICKKVEKRSLFEKI